MRAAAISVGILTLVVSSYIPAGGGIAAQPQPPGVRMTYLYDNTEAVPGVRAAGGSRASWKAAARVCCSTRGRSPTC